MKRSGAAILLLAAFSVAVLFYAGVLSAADTDFPIYFHDSKLPLKSRSVNRITYLPLVEIASHLGLPYTDDFRLETFTLGGPSARLVTTRNSALISVNGQIILLQNPVRRDDSQWWVPLDFLSQGLSRITGIEFRYRPGTARVFAGDVNPVELVMNAQALGPMTRLTLRMGAPVELDLQRDGTQRRAVIVLKDKPVDPLRERLDYKDRQVESVAFDDTDGVAKIVVALTADVQDVRTASTDENRVHFIDFLREAALTGAPPPPLPAAAAPRPDPGAGSGSLRVIVIDAGHGGIDLGTSPSETPGVEPENALAPAPAGAPAGAPGPPGGANPVVTTAQNPGDGQNPGLLGASSLVEKELTLAVARRLRTTLQSKLGATVLLTRDADVAMTSEARSAVANNNQAGLLISLHVGYSADPADSGSSIYVIQNGFAENLSPTAAQDRLFLPWFLAYRRSRPASEQMAKLLQQELTQALPGWKFPIRTGPIGVLASATMPSVALEIGNINNPANAQNLADAAFQAKLAATVAAAVEKFAATRPAGRP